MKREIIVERIKEAIVNKEEMVVNVIAGDTTFMNNFIPLNFNTPSISEIAVWNRNVNLTLCIPDEVEYDDAADLCCYKSKGVLVQIGFSNGFDEIYIEGFSDGFVDLAGA